VIKFLPSDTTEHQHVGLERLIEISLDSGSEDDRKIAVEFGVYWMNVVKDSLASQDNLVGLISWKFFFTSYRIYSSQLSPSLGSDFWSPMISSHS
jgi:hypothetical protein